ncbi:MAG: hypothetical protein ABEJ77_01095 [Halanaeroarchaeum sp.]
MPPWTCDIGDCGATFDDVEALVAHQVAGHDPHRCRMCEDVVPEGFFAIRHAVEEHTRAEYVRHYDADSDDIRLRENLVETVEEIVDESRLEREIEAARS